MQEKGSESRDIISGEKAQPRTRNREMALSEWLLLILLSLIWGFSFFFMKIAVRDFTPYTIVTVRVSIGALVISMVNFISGYRLPRSLRAWGEFSIMAILNNVLPFTLISWGLQYIDSGLGSILNATTPIFSVINVHLMTREDRLTANRVTGVIIGWLGVATMIGLGALQHIGSHFGGQLAVLGASCSYSLAAIFGRRFNRYRPLTVSSGMLICATILSLPVTLLFGNPFVSVPSAETVVSITLLGVFCTGISYLLYYRLLASAGPTNVLLVTFLVPMTAVLLGNILLGEQLAPSVALGSVLLFAGLLIIDGRALKLLRKKIKKRNRADIQQPRGHK